MRPSSNEAARALASLLAAAFPDLTADSTGASASASGASTAASSSTRTRTRTPTSADGMRAVVGAQSIMLTKPAKGPIPPPTPASRTSTSTYIPLPTRSGRVPQLPNPDDVDHSTLLFNEYLNYDWPSDDDEENDPDFNPTSDAPSAGDIWVGRADGMDLQDEVGDLSPDDDDGETDFSTMEDAWMLDDAAPLFPGGALGPAGFTDDIVIDATASTSALLADPALITHPAAMGRATRGASAAVYKSAANPSKRTGKGKVQALEPSTASPAFALSHKRLRSTSSHRHPPPATHPALPPAPSPVPDVPDPPFDAPKKRGRPKTHLDADPVEARKQRKRDAAHQSREKAKHQLATDAARLAHLEQENARLRDRVAELERPRNRRAPRARENASSEVGSSTVESSGDESDGTVRSERVVFPPGGPPGGLSVEALAELSRLLAWASAKAASAK